MSLMDVQAAAAAPLPWLLNLACGRGIIGTVNSESEPGGEERPNSVEVPTPGKWIRS